MLAGPRLSGPDRRVIVLLARAPSAAGKTRLTAHLSEARSRQLRHALLLDTLDALAATGLPSWVCYTPAAARDEFVALGAVPGFCQRGDDLGERMRNAIADAVERGAGAVALVGSDLPSLPPEYVLDGLEMSRSADVVFGPTVDGGFYLLAARSPLPDIFSGVEWSSGRECEQAIAAARAAGLTVGVLPPWWDVDVPEDLPRVLADPRPHAARRVRAWLAG